MSKKKGRKDLLTLAQWSEEMSRHTLEMARTADSKQRRRSLTFRSKRHAQIATVLRGFINDRAPKVETVGTHNRVAPYLTDEELNRAIGANAGHEVPGVS